MRNAKKRWDGLALHEAILMSLCQSSLASQFRVPNT
jgi:hypothetical protein